MTLLGICVALLLLADELNAESDGQHLKPKVNTKYTYEGNQIIGSTNDLKKSPDLEEKDCTDDMDGAPVVSEDAQRKSLLESVGEYFIGETFVTNVRQYYETIALNEVHDELERAKEEEETTADELTKAYTQLMILRRRQADLGVYIEESLKKPREQRNPTVEELVLTEDDRLALLEHRFKRIISKLKKQKLDLEKYIALHRKSTGIPAATDQFEEQHMLKKQRQSVILRSDKDELGSDNDE